MAFALARSPFGEILSKPAGPGANLWGWLAKNVVTITGVGLLLAALSFLSQIVVPIWVMRQEEIRQRADSIEDRGWQRNRMAMLRRVGSKWINGVYQPSLAVTGRIQVDLAPWSGIVRDATSSSRVLPGKPLKTRFDDSDHGLLILGSPGAGKTTMLLALTAELLEDARQEDRLAMPVIFLLSSWDPRFSSIDEWLVAELTRTYNVPPGTAARWVESGEILPMLDGFDDVSEDERADCLEAIRTYEQRHAFGRYVLTSRTSAYANLEATSTLDIVEVQPLPLERVLEFLASTALVPLRRALLADSSLLDLLRTPLALSMVAASEWSKSPALTQETNTGLRRTELFRHYTRRMLTHRTGHYSEAKMLNWLSWLARSMLSHHQTEFFLDRLNPDWIESNRYRAFVVAFVAVGAGAIAAVTDGLVYGLVHGLSRGLANGGLIGLFFFLFALLGRRDQSRTGGPSWLRLRIGVVGGVFFGLFITLVANPKDGLAVGVFFAVMFMLFSGLRRYEPVEELQWGWRRSLAGLLAGGALGFPCGFLYAVHYGVVPNLLAGIGFGCLFAGAVGLFGGLVGGLVPGMTDSRSKPNEGIHRSLRLALVTSLATGPIVGVLIGWIYSRGFAVKDGFGEGIRDGIILGLAIGMIVGGLACLEHLGVRIALWIEGSAPFRYVRFLDEASDRLLLRRAGPAYIFVHGLLLEYLADLDSESILRSASSATESMDAAQDS